ncbi:hypothetical protein Tco_0764920 [Tanacetum coccineum]
MSRTNSQAEIVSEEQLVSRANRLIIKKNNQGVASDSHITDTMLMFVVEILRHHKLYKPVSLTATGIVHSANLDFASLILDEFESQTVKRSSRPSKMSKLLYTCFTKLIITYFLSNNKSIPRRSSSKLQNLQDDQPITKLSNTVKVESENAKIVDEPEEQHVSPVKSASGKGFMCYGDQVANVPTSLKIDVVPRKTRSQTIAEETVVGELANSISIQEPRTQQRRRSQLTIDSQPDDTIAYTYAEWGQKLIGPAVEDPTVQSLLDLQKGSKASRLESLKQKKQAV